MRYYVTVMGFKAKDKDRIMKVCREIYEKDKSFVWAVNPSKFDKYDYVLRIKSEDLDTAHKRGLLLTRKYLEDLNLSYWVVK